MEACFVADAYRHQQRGFEMTITYTLAYAAGVDAADKRMRSEGRTAWNEEDWNHAVKVMTELLIKVAA